MSQLTHRMKIVYLETKTENLKTWRTLGFVLPSLSFPLMFYLFFGVIFAGMNGENDAEKVSGYLLATYAVFGVIGPALFSFGADMATEKDKGLLTLKQVSPMPVIIYFIAKALTAMGFASIITLAMFLIAALLGGVSLSAGQWIGTWLVLIVGTIPFCAMGICLGLKAKAQAAGALVNVIYLPMAFLSGLWLPIQMMPAVIQDFAGFMPAYHLSQLVLKIQAFDVGQSLWLHVMALLCFTLLFTALALKWFNCND
ncbi:ABC transporter permease [Alteromonas sediminis]|uniref:Transport permease protein n=1 Tax=Alteromonas sediminis TaxID=2259342 RepID=A0A3N5Y719_9ALTE|nr:ABC transporter permease [Alteromonas sediminis]RPJ66429.1 ABC transporter permease [Alteromonas sediminis]